MKMYRAYLDDIQPVEVDRATDKSVWITEPKWGKMQSVRHPRASDYCCYFDTWVAAHEWLIKQMDANIQRLVGHIEFTQGRLESARIKRESIRTMKEAPDV